MNIKSEIQYKDFFFFVLVQVQGFTEILVHSSTHVKVLFCQTLVQFGSLLSSKMSRETSKKIKLKYK